MATGEGGNIKDSRMADVSLQYNTKPAILRNTSGQRYVFIAPALKAGAGPYQRTYTVEQGKDCEVQAEDFIRMRYEIERLVSAGKIMIVRGVTSEIRTQDEFGTLYLKGRPQDPTNIQNDMLWLFDTKSGNNIPDEIDARVRLNGETYSLFTGLPADFMIPYQKAVYDINEIVIAIEYYSTNIFIPANLRAKFEFEYTNENLTKETLNMYRLDGSIFKTYIWTHTYSGNLYQSSGLT